MRSQWIIFFVFVATGPEALCQFRDKTSSQVQWNGLGFLGGANYVKGVPGNCGVYSSEHDRRSGTLSLAIDCKAEDHRITTGFVREHSAIKIVRESETHSFLRRDIYGYRDCNGNEYHFFKGKSFELINPGDEIPIYRTYSQRGKQRVARYFFTSTNGDILALKLDNFRDVFSDEPVFLEKLHILARNDFQLTRYLYLINLVWSNSQQNI